jgi:hypothetical protein
LISAENFFRKFSHWFLDIFSSKNSSRMSSWEFCTTFLGLMAQKVHKKKQTLVNLQF